MRKGKTRVVPSLVLGIALSVATGCAAKSGEEEVSNQNLVKSGDPNTSTVIANKFHILGPEAYRSEVTNGNISLPKSRVGSRSLLRLASSIGGTVSRALPADSTSAALDVSNPSLRFGMPISMLNQPMVFGSVITAVSDKVNENMGELKLTDIPPFQVLPKVRKVSEGNYTVALVDCGADCSKITENKVLIDIPVIGMDSEKKRIFLDLASLGQGLDLTALLKGHPTLKQFKSVASKTVLFDYSKSTLVFDVEAHLISTDATAGVTPSSSSSPDSSSPSETVITNRWYLKSGSAFNPKFVQRKPVAGVGFFTTEKSTEPLLERWDFDARGANKGIKYYVKNVPAQYQPAFAKAFDGWNSKLQPILGKKVFDYEFVGEDDPRKDLLVPGDVRYNILEWDLVNKAGYGGLGPSIANQYTGEIFHANVLIQGPTIVSIYTKWFKVQEEARALRADGRAAEAERIIAQASREIRSEVSSVSDTTFKVKLGNGLEMRVRSQEPPLQDPIMDKEEFDLVPEGYTYSEYMDGYFLEMVAHELGHDLGLRHNFKGSQGALDDVTKVGSVSRSIMEYLGRRYRQLNVIGEYDLMAISYGYLGLAPAHDDWYCTDEDSADLHDSSKSAECSPEDATNDPFTYFYNRLKRGTNLLVGRGQEGTPEWTADEMKTQLNGALNGMGSYAASADETSKQWIHFFGREDRPQRSSDVKGYVLAKVKEVLCDSSLESEIDTKATDEAKTKARKNIVDLRLASATALKPIYSAEELACTH